jgi:preprotein translocase subunit SecG
MYELILIVHVVLAFGLICLILLQQGKGASIGAAFGSGASNTVFGSPGSGNFLTRGTAIMATLFFATSISLSYIAARHLRPNTAQDIDLPRVQQKAPAQQKANPVAPVMPTAPDVPDVDQ